jgi:hypothetical protein
VFVVGVVVVMLLALAPGSASAAASWQSGPLVESQDFNCITGDVEQEAGTYMSYYTDPASPPQVGQTFYVAIDVTGIGNTCAGIYADVNLLLPSGLSVAIDGTHPVYCYLGFPGASSYTRDTQDCPQSLGFGPNGYSLDPVHANPPFWPLPQGGTVEIQVPVKSSVSGTVQFGGYVQLADGDLDPTLGPTMYAVIDPAATTGGTTGNQIGIYYQTPSISGQSETGSGPVRVTYTGYVQNDGNDGTVVAQLAKAGSAGDCSNPATIFTTPPASLQHPNTAVNGNFTGLYPGGAYCWRFVASVSSGVSAGTYTGNWEYFATIGTFTGQPASSYVPPPAKPLQVPQCTTNGSGCATSNCNAGSSCSGGGSVGGLSHTLTIAFGGTGGGHVTGTGGISCASSCNRTYPTTASPTVTLTAAPGTGSTFAGWSGGGCSRTGTCTVKMSADQSVTANFAVIPKPVCSLSALSSKVVLRKRKGSKTPLDTLLLSAKCDQTANGQLSGTLAERVSRKQTKHITLKPLSVSLLAGAARTIDLKLPAAAIKGLKKGYKESVALTLSVTNANGAASASVSLRRLHTSG